jgi:Ca2+-transporting ATPase
MSLKGPWACSVDEVVHHFNSHVITGLSSSYAEILLKETGRNSLPEEKGASWPMLFFKQFRSAVTYVLGIGMLVSFYFGHPWDGGSIGLILLLNAGIGFFQERKAEISLKALKKLSTPKARVLRDSKIIEIDAELVVPGDILIFETGDCVIADGRVVESYQLFADESILTGESLPLEKGSDPVEVDAILAEQKNMLFSGTIISSGRAKVITIATGLNTELGKIAKLIEAADPHETPLQKRLNNVTHKLLGLGLILTAFVCLRGFYRQQPLHIILMDAISLTVAAIPEGLPTVVTLALVMAVFRMSKKNALIRNLTSVETLGSTDVICTDKTGTLTTGKMEVADLFLLRGESDKALEVLILCNNATLDGIGSGDSTEVALLSYAKTKTSVMKMRLNFPRLYEWTFDSERKRMSVAVQSSGKLAVYLKGAPESVLNCCLMNDSERQRVGEMLTNFSGQGMRTIALAYKAINEQELNQGWELIERDMNFIGLVALADPPRDGSRASVLKCRSAGIRVIMMTGDHPLTALHIAHHLSIIDEKAAQVLTGGDINKLADDQFNQLLASVNVYARVSPEQKMKIVEGLEASGHTVAMTGDGVNDAPALKKASIGIAMGMTGTEVARQASDVILMDDHFSTIVDAVEEGRALHANISRSLQYLLATNLAELLVVLGASVMTPLPPLNPLAILWINLVTDGLPSLAIACEKVPESFLEKSQRPSPSSFFNKRFYVELMVISFTITVFALTIFYHVLQKTNSNVAGSYIFNFLVFSVLLSSFANRSGHLAFWEMKPNRFHLLAVLIPFLLQILIQKWHFAKDQLHIESLSFKENIILFLLSLIPLLLMESIKLFRREKSHSVK